MTGMSFLKMKLYVSILFCSINFNSFSFLTICWRRMFFCSTILKSSNIEESLPSLIVSSLISSSKLSFFSNEASPSTGNFFFHFLISFPYFLEKGSQRLSKMSLKIAWSDLSNAVSNGNLCLASSSISFQSCLSFFFFFCKVKKKTWNFFFLPVNIVLQFIFHQSTNIHLMWTPISNEISIDSFGNVEFLDFISAQFEFPHCLEVQYIFFLISFTTEFQHFFVSIDCGDGSQHFKHFGIFYKWFNWIFIDIHFVFFKRDYFFFLFFFFLGIKQKKTIKMSCGYNKGCQCKQPKKETIPFFSKFFPFFFLKF